MALACGRFTMDAAEVLSIMCACHLYVSCQALDLRALHLAFVEGAGEALKALNAQMFPSSTQEELSRLDSAMQTHLADAWPRTNTLTIEERCRVTAQIALDAIVHVFASRGAGAGPCLADVALWQERASSALNELYFATAERFAQNPHTATLLGTGSKTLYQTVRQTLGVPFYRGLIEHPTAEDGTLDGRDKKTIGSWISIIYEAIRLGNVFQSLLPVLETATLVGEPSKARSRDLSKL